MSDKTKTNAGFRNVPVRMSAELEGRVKEAAAKVGLSSQDVIRLAIERGIIVLKEQLLSKQEGQAA